MFLASALVIQLLSFKKYRIGYLLQELNINDGYIVFQDIQLKVPQGRNVKIDCLILSSYGIFVISSKKYRGWITGYEGNPIWNVSFFNKSKSVPNPILENNDKIKLLEQLLGRGLFISIICTTFIKGLSIISPEVHVTNEREVMKTILRYRKNIFSPEDLLKMENIILRNIITDNPSLTISLEKNG